MNQHPVPIYVGYDGRESAAYHVFCQSVLERSSIPVSFIPLNKANLQGFDGKRDGSNDFIYSRFLVPYLQNFKGWALYFDGDMVMLEDVARLWELRDQFAFNFGAAVVKHNYETKHTLKYIGTKMQSVNASYPRKNWSSVVLWNCGHYANRCLLPDIISQSSGAFLHRFSWLQDDQIGALPPEWNAIAEEQDIAGASVIHYSLGVPGFEFYKHCDGADHWHRAMKRVNHLED